MTKIEVLEREHISELVEQAGSVYQLSKRQGYNRHKFLTSSKENKAKSAKPVEVK